MSDTESTMEQPGSSNGQGSDENLETVRKVYVRDLHPKQQVHTVFRVMKKAKQTARSGKSFLAVELADKTGEVDARVFDQIDAFDEAFSQGDYVLLRGEVIVFHGKNQLVISRLEKLDPGPIDPAEFTPPPRAEKPAQAKTESKAPEAREPREPRAAAEPRVGGTQAIGQIREICERLIDPQVRALVQAFLDDPELKLAQAHRAGVGEALLSAVKQAQRVSEQNPSADKDLLIAGTLLRGICRVREAQREHLDEARLVGAVVMSAVRIGEKASKLENFPPLLTQHLIHLVVASDVGPTPRPATLEAILVQAIWALETGASAFVEAVRKDGSRHETWTEVARGFDRHLWKGPSPTARAKTPSVERRPRRERPERAEKGPRTERSEAKEAAPKLAFKPLAELAPDAVSAPEASSGIEATSSKNENPEGGTGSENLGA